MKHRLILLMSLMLVPIIVLAEVNWVLQIGGMYKKEFGGSIWETGTYDILGGLHLQIPVTDQIPLFLETGLDYRNKDIIEQLGDYKLDSSDPDWSSINDINNASSFEIPLKVGYRLAVNEKNSLEFGLGPYASYCLSSDLENKALSVGLTSSVVFRHRCMSFGLSYSNPIFYNGPRDYNTNLINVTVGLNFGKKAWSAIGKVAMVTGTVIGTVADAYVQNYGQSSNYSSGTSSYYDTSESYSSSSSYSNKSEGNSGGNYETFYQRWERQAENAYNSLTHASVSASTYNRNKKLLRDAQKEMRDIRRKASAAGVRIEKSKWEDVQVKLK